MCVSQASHTSVGWEDAEPHTALSLWLELEQLSITPRAFSSRRSRVPIGMGV